MRTIESIPNAARTFEALRSLGYNLNSSIADVIDNAITEKVSAKNIHVYFNFNQKGNIVCRILDDGKGMSENVLEEAMRLGTDTTYKERDLGKFGMGMKTASLSHCEKLTVISKSKGSEVACFRWDMSHIRNTQEWHLHQLSLAETQKVLHSENITLQGSGTVVLWDDLFLIDREYKSYGSKKLGQNFYFRIEEELKLYLRTVYHRFLDGSLNKNRAIKLFVNDDPLTPWDPFCSSEPNSQRINLNKKLSELHLPGYKTPVLIEGFILPNKEAFSNESAWREAKGLNSWNDSQGYYIYRADRLIRFGGWHGTKAKDEHDKLARISIDIDPSLDSLFRITVNKTKVQFPEILFYHLKNQVNPGIVKKAKAKYNKSEENLNVNNNFRKKTSLLSEVSKNLLKENNIRTHLEHNGSNDIEVKNPNGTWLSNKIQEFLKYGTEKDFEVISGHIAGNHLWKIVCANNDKFKVIINASHPFYSKVYKSGNSKAVTDVADALIFSLAFAELFNKNDQNAHLFNTFNAVCSKALERLTKEEVI